MMFYRGSFKQPVVPALMALALLVKGQEPRGRKVKFGTRVQQAKSLCTDRENCQFGYTFDGQLRENLNAEGEDGDFRQIVFVPPSSTSRTSSRRSETQVRIAEQQIDEPQDDISQVINRRRNRLNIDPRRRTQLKGVDTTTEESITRSTESRKRPVTTVSSKSSNRKDPAFRRNNQSRGRKPPQQQRSFDLFTPTPPEDLFEDFPTNEETVTINIGGTPIIIPDFDLSPESREKPVSFKRTQNKRPPVKATKPTRKTSSVSNQRRNRKQQKSKNQRNKSQVNHKLSQVNTTPTPSTQRRTTKAPIVQNTFATTLTSFNSLLESRETFRSFNNFTPGPQTTISKPINRIQAQSAVKGNVRQKVPATTVRARPAPTSQRRKQTSNARSRQKSATPKRPSPKPVSFSKAKAANSLCPGSLEDCVDTCVPLEDIYAYSACVVECGERC